MTRLGELTLAERLVVELAARGLQNSQIARSRRRSVFTVTNQLGAAYRKLGVSSRRELAAKLREPSPSVRAGEGAVLSRREREVWLRVYRGQANKVIACDLGVSLSSVAKYVARARNKLSLTVPGG